MPNVCATSRRLFCGLAICVGALGFVFPVWAQDVAPAAQSTAPLPALKRGVNLSNWFAEGQRVPLVVRDFDGLKKAGFDHVRIPINPELLGFSLADASTGRVLFDFAKLDEAVNMARDAGLATILDIHPTEGIASLIEQDSSSEAGMIALWTRIADHYKTYAGGFVTLELLNEPSFRDDLSKYRTLITDGVEAIRKIAPDLPIVVDVPKGANVEGFDGFSPLDDARTFYAFHFYEPYIFTHQGLKVASSRGRALRYIRNLPYPSSRVDAKGDYAPNAPDAQEAAAEVSQYVAANWDAARIAAWIKLAADWGKAYHRHVICTEFGVVRHYASPNYRYLWIEHARKAFEAGGLGWDIWDYGDLFGITKLIGETALDPTDGSIRLVDPEQGSRDIEPEALKALFQN